MKRVKWFRNTLLILLSALMVLGGLPSSVMAGDTTDFEKYNGFEQRFVEANKMPSGKTGQKVTVTFVITNPDDDELKNATIRFLDQQEFKDAFDIDDDDDEEVTSAVSEYPFEYVSDMKEKKKLGTIKEKSKRSVSMSCKVKRNLKEGYYPATFRLEYENGGGVNIGVNIWISTSTSSTEEDENNKIDYDFTMGEGQPTPYAAYGQVMDYGVNLRNSGLKKVYDVRVYMQLNSDTTKFPFDINDGNYDRLMGDMESGQGVTIPYSMAVREDVKSGFFPIAYKITYREEAGGDFVEPIDKEFYVRVKGEDDDELSPDANESDRTKARIVVDSFSTEPGEVYAGNVFTLKVRMKNASSDVSASNIMFTFASEEVNSSPVFTTGSGSTSVVVNQLSPGATTDLQLQFESSPTAEQKSYVMTIKEKYDSPEFKNAAEEVKISIPVKQKPRLNTGTIDVMPDNISVGAESNIMFGVNNTGKVLLYNVSATFVGDSIQKTDAYVGNIKPGETGNVDTMITGIAPTTDDGKIKIVISFEDENGNTTEIEKEMSLIVTEASEEIPGDMEAGLMGEEEMLEPKISFFSQYRYPLMGAAALVVAGIGVIIWKKKKKKAAEEEEIDDEISGSADDEHQ